jgi:hypothetical protein
MRALLTLALLVLATAASADHHEQDLCPFGHIGNCSGPGDQQNETYHLGRFAPGDTFPIGFYYKDQADVPDRCELAWWVVSDFYTRPIGPFVYNFANNPELEPLVSSPPPGQSGPDIITYIYPSTPTSTGLFEQPAGIFDEMPQTGGILVEGYYEYKFRMADFTLNDSSEVMPGTVGNPDEPLGWHEYEIDDWTPEGQELHQLGLSRGWELRASDGATCDCNPVNPWTCPSTYVEWLEDKYEANQFTFVVDCWDGNLDHDPAGLVGGPDWSVFAAAYGSERGDANYNWDADATGDGKIGGKDFTLFIAAYNDPNPPMCQ